MIGRFLELNPSIELKDDTRGFSESQRIAIYRRDKGQNYPDARSIKGIAYTNESYKVYELNKETGMIKQI